MSDQRPRERDAAAPATTSRPDHRANHKGGPLSRMMSAGILALIIVALLLLVWIF